MLFQQVSARGLVALKFLVLARLLGPTALGVIGVAIVTLAVAEALTELGLGQAIVQAPANPTERELGAVWGVLVTRGLLISAALLLMAPLIARAFGAATATQLIALIAVVPIVRNGASVGIFIAQRNRRFRAISLVQLAATTADLATTVLLLATGIGLISAVWGAIVGELARTGLSHLRFPAHVVPTLKTGSIADLLGFGRWIWGSSILNLALNQSDKVIVGVLLGPTALGVYQMASKLGQLVIAEFSIAIGQFLFPTIAEHHRRSANRAAEGFVRAFNFAWVAALGISASVGIVAPQVIELLLGNAWKSAVPVFRVLVVAMFFGALIAVLAAYLRAVGRPGAVTRSAAVQLLVYAPLAYGLGRSSGAVGVALAVAIGMVVTTSLLMVSARQGLPLKGSTLTVTIAAGAAIAASRTFPSTSMIVACSLALTAAVILYRSAAPKGQHANSA